MFGKQMMCIRCKCVEVVDEDCFGAGELPRLASKLCKVCYIFKATVVGCLKPASTELQVWQIM